MIAVALALACCFVGAGGEGSLGVVRCCRCAVIALSDTLARVSTISDHSVNPLLTRFQLPARAFSFRSRDDVWRGLVRRRRLSHRYICMRGPPNPLTHTPPRVRHLVFSYRTLSRNRIAISEVSKRVPIWLHDIRGGKQVSPCFQQRN